MLRLSTSVRHFLPSPLAPSAAVTFGRLAERAIRQEAASLHAVSRTPLPPRRLLLRCVAARARRRDGRCRAGERLHLLPRGGHGRVLGHERHAGGAALPRRACGAQPRAPRSVGRLHRRLRGTGRRARGHLAAPCGWPRGSSHRTCSAILPTTSVAGRPQTLGASRRVALCTCEWQRSTGNEASKAAWRAAAAPLSLMPRSHPGERRLWPLLSPLRRWAPATALLTIPAGWADLPAATVRSAPCCCRRGGCGRCRLRLHNAACAHARRSARKLRGRAVLDAISGHNAKQQGPSVCARVRQELRGRAPHRPREPHALHACAHARPRGQQCKRAGRQPAV
jgi:hypothetical protein